MTTELKSAYTFENFVVGDHNRLAYDTARNAVDHPGSYIFLYIYGGEGLGKTHLLHAIGQEARNQGRLVLYLTAEEFRARVLWTIQNNERDYFQERFGSLNFLLLDDIDSLGQTEEAQERLFHWFNTLYSDGCQIVITGRRHPRSMPLLEERLKNRLEWGLITGINPPVQNSSC